MTAVGAILLFAAMGMDSGGNERSAPLRDAVADPTDVNAAGRIEGRASPLTERGAATLLLGHGLAAGASGAVAAAAAAVVYLAFAGPVPLSNAAIYTALATALTGPAVSAVLALGILVGNELVFGDWRSAGLAALGGLSAGIVSATVPGILLVVAFFSHSMLSLRATDDPDGRLLVLRDGCAGLSLLTYIAVPVAVAAGATAAAFAVRAGFVDTLLPLRLQSSNRE